MDSLRVGRLNLGIGLEWVLAGDGRDLQARLAGRRFAAWVRYPGAEGLLVGLLDKSGRTLRSCYAGALLVARAVPDAIVHQALASGRVWTSVLVQGVPVPGSDQVSESAVAGRMVEQYRTAFPGSAIVGDHALAQQSLADAIASLAPAQRRPALLKARHGWLSLLLLVVFFLSAVAVFAIDGNDTSERSMPVMTGQSGDSERDRQERLLQTFAQQQASLAEQHLNVGSLSAVAKLWLQQIESLPPSLGGYRATQLICAPRYCDIDWTPTQSMVLEAELLPGATAPEQASGRMRTRVDLSGGEPFPHTVLSAGAEARLRATLPVRLQRLGGRTDVEVPGTAITLPPPQDLKVPAFVLGQPVDIRASVTGWANVRGVLGVLSAEGVMPDKAVFGISGGKVNMQFEGHHVVAVQ